MINPRKQVTLIQIVDILSDIAFKHSQIRAFFAGDISNYKPVDSFYPLMWIHVGESYQRLSELEYDVNITIVDRLETDQTNLMQVLSDTRQICSDVYSLLKYGNQLYQLLRIDNSLEQQGSGTLLQATSDAVNQDIVAGWSMMTKIKVDYVNDICSIPGIQGTDYLLP